MDNQRVTEATNDAPTLPGDMVATKKGNRTEVAWKVGHPREHQVIIEMIESAVGPKVRFNEPLHPVLVVQVIEYLMGRRVHGREASDQVPRRFYVPTTED